LSCVASGRSYIWADGTLVATVEDNSTIHYVYTDHLGTPRAVTATTSDTPIWTWPWLQNPFGEQPASGAGGYTFNLRYPGQYYDSETGLSYNYFRDYEPGTGRYGESDPMGLAAGANTYSYVGTDPLSYIDPFGLDETRIVNTSGGRSVWDGPTNGNWGGKCWSGGQYSCGGRPMGNAPPTDSADRCYMHRDNCYDKCNVNVECMEACNKELIKELHNLPDDPTKWPQAPRRGTERDSRTYRAGAFLLWGH
jgi:RHS repeat-associated protein